MIKPHPPCLQTILKRLPAAAVSLTVLFSCGWLAAQPPRVVWQPPAAQTLPPGQAPPPTQTPPPGQAPQPGQAPPRKPVELGPADIGASQDVIPEGPISPIDLSTALRLAERDNPSLAISRQAIQAAAARRMGAYALALPHLRAGMNLHQHFGVLQTSFGLMRRVDSQSFYIGGGSRTLAAESLAFPALQISAQVGDVFFEPLAANQLVASRTFDARAATNNIFLQVASGYLDLMSAEAQLRAIRLSEQSMGEVVEITTAHAKTGLGLEADALRTRARARLLRIDEERAQGQVEVASAALARLLHLDPSVRLRTPVGAIAMLDLVDPNLPVEQLIAIAERARPELASNRAEIERQDVQLRQAMYRPLFPNLMVGFSGGAFSGSSNRLDLVHLSPHWGPLFGRTDYDVLAYWQLDNLGAGNVAHVRRERAERDTAAVEWQRTRARVRREVVEAYGSVQQAYASVQVAEERVAVAERGFQEELRRIRAAAGLPIEVLDMLHLLVTARDDLIRKLVEYDTAQFQLFVATGQTPMAGAVPEPSQGPGGPPGPEPLPMP